MVYATPFLLQHKRKKLVCLGTAPFREWLENDDPQSYPFHLVQYGWNPVSPDSPVIHRIPANKMKRATSKPRIVRFPDLEDIVVIPQVLDIFAVIGPPIVPISVINHELRH